MHGCRSTMPPSQSDLSAPCPKTRSTNLPRPVTSGEDAWTPRNTAAGARLVHHDVRYASSGSRRRRRRRHVRHGDREAAPRDDVAAGPRSLDARVAHDRRLPASQDVRSGSISPTSRWLRRLNDDFREPTGRPARPPMPTVHRGRCASSPLRSTGFHRIDRRSRCLDREYRYVRGARMAGSARVQKHRSRRSAWTRRDHHRPRTVIQIGLPPRRIDLLTRITGVEFDDALRRRVRACHRRSPDCGILGRAESRRERARDRARTGCSSPYRCWNPASAKAEPGQGDATRSARSSSPATGGTPRTDWSSRSGPRRSRGRCASCSTGKRRCASWSEQHRRGATPSRT